MGLHLAGMVRQPGGRATHTDAVATQRAWNHYVAFMRQRHPGLYYSGPIFQLWDMRPSHNREKVRAVRVMLFDILVNKYLVKYSTLVSK